jgi:hypothetical protein
MSPAFFLSTRPKDLWSSSFRVTLKRDWFSAVRDFVSYHNEEIDDKEIFQQLLDIQQTK